MRFMDASLPGDTDDVPVTMAVQVQKAVDCYNAGAIVLHTQVHDDDGKGPKRMFMLNDAGSPMHCRAEDGAVNGDLEPSHLVRHP